MPILEVFHVSHGVRHVIFSMESRDVLKLLEEGRKHIDDDKCIYYHVRFPEHASKTEEVA